MGNLFAGLSSGSRALSYYQRGIETAGHNVANATTEGFSRQRVNPVAVAPTNDGGFWIGQGVDVSAITRMRDIFVDAQYRREIPVLGYWETRMQNITNLEYYVGDYDRATFQATLDNYWTNVESVHTNPSAATTREALVQSAKDMITSLTNMRANYDAYRYDLNTRIVDMVTEANQLIDDIAVITNKIALAANIGENPNDLLDERDLMAERLCKLTGATVSNPTVEEADGDYKIDLNGKFLVQGGALYDCKGQNIVNTRHLMLQPMVGNYGYYDVQVEYNQYEHSSDYSVASVVIERGATNPEKCPRNGVHDLFVERLANGRTWMVGGALGQSAGGERLDTIYSKDQALGISGTFSLEVGNAGVQAQSKIYIDPSNSALAGVIAQDPNVNGGPTEYEFRIAAGDFETYVNIKFNGTDWDFTSSNGSVTNLGSSAGADLTVEDIVNNLNNITLPSGDPAFTLTGAYDDPINPTVMTSFTIEADNNSDMRGHLLSITDVRGSLSYDMEIANKNPAVEITVTEDDTLTTIANKINDAYKCEAEYVTGDNAVYTTNPPGSIPSTPEAWLHANIVKEPNGTYYLALTSNVSGEANRINVLPGSVCDTNGDLSVARLLGFVGGADPASGSPTNATSYMQLSDDPNALSTIVTGDVYVNDAYFIYDDKHYLSESNSFADARIFKRNDVSNPTSYTWVNQMADELDRFGTGVRLNLHNLNTRYLADGSAASANDPVHIYVRPHLLTGEIYATLEARDDMVLGFEDYLDQIAYELVTEVNAVHYAGHGTGTANSETTGTAFFNHITQKYGASSSYELSINDAIVKDISLIAAGSGDGTGHSRGSADGANALAIAQLKQTKLFDGGSADFNEYFLKFVADLGTQGYTASYMLTSQQDVIDQLNTLRDSVMGVNTDEEMIDIIRFQQGISAIARYMTAIDDMLDRLINGMGRVGL
ncbi:MAG: flagellar hook-associated protein FlgK [Synergistaceae bacterium]|jgi:flagellar hook-associated protein 1 FlgK|nr:flagellar hook-associated protein FlgK [Synergistaceae bacterium]